jgi:transcriptional regulator with XRE-family HTH domain
MIRKLEQGHRHTASIGTLQRIARALDVDIGRLLGPSRPVSAAGEPPTPAAVIRDVLTSVDDLLGELDDVDAPDLTELGRAVSCAWGLFYAGRYGPPGGDAAPAPDRGAGCDARGYADRLSPCG